jgi:hypothetical protein
MVVGGFDQALQGLAAQLKIIRNTPVAEIDYSAAAAAAAAEEEGEEGGRGGGSSSGKGKVKVTTASGMELEADLVVVTLPLGVLKAGDVKFSPPLPDWKAGAVERLGFGHLNKVVLQFPVKFWGSDTGDSPDFFGVSQPGGAAGRGRCFMFWDLEKFTGVPLVTALVSGQAAVTAEAAADEDMVEAALQVRGRLAGWWGRQGGGGCWRGGGMRTGGCVGEGGMQWAQGRRRRCVQGGEMMWLCVGKQKNDNTCGFSAPQVIQVLAERCIVVAAAPHPPPLFPHPPLQALRTAFGTSAVPAPTAHVVTRWGSDPYARGAYSYVATGASGRDYDALATPVARCLLFAGEHTIKEHPDTVGGALLSGMREAGRALGVLRGASGGALGAAGGAGRKEKRRIAEGEGPGGRGGGLWWWMVRVGRVAGGLLSLCPACLPGSLLCTCVATVGAATVGVAPELLFLPPG